LLVHGTVDLDFKDSRYNPMSSGELALLGMDYIALGHFHNTLRVLERVKTYTTRKPGTSGFDEEGSTVSYWQNRLCVKRGKKLQVKFEKTCKRQYKSFEIKSDCFESDDQIIDEIFRKAVKDENRNDLVHITLKGYTMPGYRINAANIASAIEDSFFYAVVNDET